MEAGERPVPAERTGQPISRLRSYKEAVAVHVRPATQADLPAIEQVATTTWWATYAAYIPAETIARFLVGAYNQDRLQHRLTAAAQLLVVEAAGALVGFAQFNRKGQHDGHLTALYVLPTHQGTGAGSLLLAEGLRCLSPLHHLYLEVEEANERAVAWYGRKGFLTVGRYEEQLGDYTANLLEMVLDVR
jgi:ribosomal protein S18 acetylase RimI-like enzyme